MIYNIAESHTSSRSSYSSVTLGPSSTGTADQRHGKCLCYFVEEGGASKPEDSCTLRCSTCVQRSLRSHLERHEQAVAAHAQAREECARQLDAIPHHRNRLGELQVESQRLRDRLAALRKQCADMAVRVASQAVDNDSNREVTRQALAGGGVEEPQILLARMEHSFLQGSMHHALDVAARQVRLLRFQWARKALAMQRLDIDPNDIKLTPLQERRQKKNAEGRLPSAVTRQARGIGKIGGLPLPHAGPELYGILPPRELQSALRLVAAATCTVARCLGIVLPHPILLTPGTTSTGSATGDITDTVSDHELQRRLRESHHTTSLQRDPIPSPAASPYDQPSTSTSSSTSSILSMMDTSYWKRSAKKALARATGQTKLKSSTFSRPSASSGSYVNTSMDFSQLTLRIHHATAAVLAEDTSPNSSKFALSAEVMHQEDFAIALQLLQNDIVVLCIRAGVPVAKLWPAQAILLNLYQLDQYCQEQTAVAY